jgi:hypothetical protein
VTINLQFAQHKEPGSAITVTKEDGSSVFAFDPSEDDVLDGYARRYTGAILSSPDFTLGDTYHMFVDGIQQGYTGTDVMMHPGGMGGGRPDFSGERPEPPEGQFPQMPDGKIPERPEDQPPQFPDGEMPQPPNGQFPQMPEGGFHPMGGDFPGREDDNITLKEPRTKFYMQDKVNFFSGLSAAE